MTEPKLDLIYGGKLPPSKTARRTDPETSHEAAGMNAPLRGSHREMMLRAFVNAGWDGLTDPQAAARCGLDRVEATRRASELRGLGLLEFTGEYRRSAMGARCRVWRCTPTGRRTARMEG